MKSILFLQEEKAFVHRLEQTLRPAGFEVVCVASPGEFEAQWNKKPYLCLIPFVRKREEWREWLVGKSGNLIPPIVPILGYGEDLTLMECAQAERAGCDRVITRKALEHNPRWQVSLHARPEFEEARAKALPAGVEEGIRLFNAHKFHDSHDEIEAVWHKEPGGVRVLYQGILQAGIVYYFLEKQNATVALRMSRIARLKLRHFLPAFQGIDLDPLYHDLLRTEEKVRNLATRGPVKFPMADVPRIQIFSGKDSQMKKKGK